MRNACDVAGCDQFCVGRGLCRKHYMRVERTGTTDDCVRVHRICTMPGCGKPWAAQGLCDNHWNQRRQKEQRMAEKLANPRECPSCGTPIPPTRRWRGPVSYCSRKCQQKARVASGKRLHDARQSYFKHHYGLTLEQVDEMASRGCAICGTTEWMGRHDGPHIDHDHSTGEVRGVLCHNCNLALGHFHDDPDLLQAAIDYLAS